MFGTKFRSWMEAHIVRPRKKKDRKKGDKGFDSNCNSPSSHSANRSPAPHQVHPVEPPSKNLDTIHLHASAYTTVTTTSGTSGGTGSVHLSSPESAYSTGYSTDGTSPGASYPPEYYINIRTGTHYFQSSKGGVKKIAEDAAPPVERGNGKLVERGDGMDSSSRTARDFRESRTSTPNKNSEGLINHQNRQQPQPKQPTHRRTESCSVDASRISNFLPVPTSIPPPLVPSPPLQSPRQRSRIRTNPWLSANSSGSSTTGVKSRLTVDESSSSSGLKLTESSGSASDVNVNLNVTRNSECRNGSLSAGRSPINQNWRISPRTDIRSKVPIPVPRCSSSSSGSSLTRSVRSSEDDITLNEMMGKFDESYVYEKETDILSDSDPTDCEDYVDSLSDIDTGRDGGDENEPFENDDFDFIDNGSLLDLDKLDHVAFRNTGHCTYFTFTSELSRKGTRLRESFLKRRAKDSENGMHRTSVRTSSKRQSTRLRKGEEKSGEKRKKRVSQRRKPPFDKCDDETANINRVLVERMLLTNSGFNQGSRSVGGTPICLRRKKLADVNKNLSPLKLQDNSVVRSVITENEIMKRRSNSVSYVNGNMVRRHLATGSTYMTTFASEIALMEADKEADKKYRELILEAENILVNMKNNSSPVMPSPRKIHNGLANKRVELIKNTELNIELALSKSRNSQPELQSGSIKDLEHTSPKRQFAAQPCSPIRKFMERNSPNGIILKENLYKQELTKCPNSPMMIRRTPQNSPSRSVVQSRLQITERDIKEDKKEQVLLHNGVLIPGRLAERNISSPYANRAQTFFAHKEKSIVCKKEIRSSRAMKDEGLTSSSSDSDDRCDVRQKPPLLTFRSIDIGPTREASSYCPQSEPVKRKVYAGSATYGRIQKSLGEHNVAFRNSDGDTATDDTDDSKRSLREKVAQLRQERLAAEANMNAQDTQQFQHQLSELRRQMLVQTIEGLKRSLEDQSATLKQTCLETVLDDNMN